MLKYFASDCLLLKKRKINEPFRLANASNLTHEFLYDNLTKFSC